MKTVNPKDFSCQVISLKSEDNKGKPIGLRVIHPKIPFVFSFSEPRGNEGLEFVGASHKVDVPRSGSLGVHISSIPKNWVESASVFAQVKWREVTRV